MPSSGGNSRLFIEGCLSGIERDALCCILWAHRQVSSWKVSLKAHQGICQSKLRSQSQSHEPRNVRSSLPLSFRKTSFSKKHGILSAKKGICMGETYLSTAGKGSNVRYPRNQGNGRYGIPSVSNGREGA